MGELQIYETVIREGGKRALLRKSLWIAGYAFLFSLFFVWSATQGLSFPILILGALITLAACLLTKRFTGIEYEYSLLGETMTVAKIYGKRQRRTLLEIPLKRARLIAPRTPDYQKQAEAMEPREIYRALSQPSAENQWMLLWDDEDDDGMLLLLFEADDRMLRHFRRENPRATVRQIPHTPTNS